ncbi:hypothetical protein [Merismopedia glauca]|uniref:Uncharacterized protein n=1 Tax=Merismopedia glauca CCAP 1448/3 TaxID=1296344 RepID=A0A2T1C5C8_9CYAN|nr:hypothetical protein [Merismopedia glauca]PSB03482.1 hypothetical protein C7B64_08325 [Merismopedia glauca CCAP 1448/3]
MKIIEHNDRSLHIADRNRQCLWGLLFATPFIAISLGVTVLTAKLITLECQRLESRQIECQRTVTGIFGAEKDRIPGNLKTATTIKTSGIGVVLETTKGRVELAPYRAFVTDRIDKTVDRLNAFIKNPQQATISVEQDDRWANYLGSVNFFIGGMAIAFGALAIPVGMSCKLDRNSGEVIIAKKYWLYGDRQMVLPLSKIDRALVRELPFSLNRKSVYNIHLVPSAGKKVSLSVPSQNLSQYQEIVDVTNDFLRRYA